jgi:hypothetical protein
MRLLLHIQLNNHRHCSLGLDIYRYAALDQQLLFAMTMIRILYAKKNIYIHFDLHSVSFLCAAESADQFSIYSTHCHQCGRGYISHANSSQPAGSDFRAYAKTSTRHQSP